MVKLGTKVVSTAVTQKRKNVWPYPDEGGGVGRGGGKRGGEIEQEKKGGSSLIALCPRVKENR